VETEVAEVALAEVEVAEEDEVVERR